MALDRDIWVRAEKVRMRKERKFTIKMGKAMRDGLKPVLDDPFFNVRNYNYQHIIDTLKELYLDTSEPFFINTYREVQKEANKDFASDIASIFTQRVLDWFQVYGAEKVTSITDTVREGLQKIISNTITEGFGAEKTAREIQKSFSEFSRVRARAIARTETVAASNRGSLLGAQATGQNVQKYWIASRDGRVRDTHADAGREYNRSNPIALDANFKVGGSRMDAPASGGSAEEVVNCRCTLGYVVIRNNNND